MYRICDRLLNRKKKMLFSDLENSHIPSFVAIAKKLKISTNVAAILDPPFRILQF